MALSPEEVNHVAMLARLALSEDEKTAFAEQLSLILDYVERLNELDTGEVEPLIHILPVFNVLRPDEALPGSSQEEILSNAPLVEDGQYKVPRII
ncbi:Asp-tRNA(Asn)/Glu-tRNA(Gln) amidotransferase subunit GatC [Syntrophomonas wolfei]|jgi:aspartyl-tRNA(Asn)/glutamyl-tRNA(Gln) amidotransferase subunit C|uniref:Aspartyl/glutamyl-tRNA(Asn/Gln) amidotransferase subunit C n=1 Tax=Syntrophomonas wolfei TaxID=863 RepID=A0A354YXM3_9FIRM|nr:Asp-tRNA(Asn)/Glu-tRNA(Gln) amidotransferase subunit GatC [Syntrophomonas wolfei]HBK53959.1 Asp-tRNA(Asn)/Glu-tRNA(Gln) amidotransferase subunit GatC [Syntrophomonas wolfei]